MKQANCLLILEFRQLRCTTPDGQFRGGPYAARCNLILKDLEEETPGRAAPEDDGCFVVSFFKSINRIMPGSIVTC